MSGPLRSILIIAGTLAVLGAAAVVAVLVASPAEPSEFEPGTPEAVVQEYINALQERDIERAYDLLSENARDDVSREDFRSYTRPWQSPNTMQRIRLTDVDVRNDRATVTVTVETTTGTGINVSRYSYQQTVPLVREDGEWRIDDPYLYFSMTVPPSATG
jgi:hypothetical protein